MMAEVIFYPVLHESELPNGERLFLEMDGQAILLFNIAGRFFAIADVCTHDHGELGEGDLEGYEIICPRHGARFDVRNGNATRLPAVQATTHYPVRIVDGMVEVGINS
jgi:3-phenylpropionate/trans-cinnamate dioxygenase ferredoxin subunit